jgi:2-iminobutanoate/2-iminopropanoate deaminase
MVVSSQVSAAGPGCPQVAPKANVGRAGDARIPGITSLDRTTAVECATLHDKVWHSIHPNTWRISVTARQAISTDNAPQALGPYSQAIVANGFVFCSGTAGIDPATGIAPDGIEEQTELALRNLDTILVAAGASLANVVKTTIFYANVDDFATINAVYARHMPDPPPARSAPGNVNLPRNLLISIEAIAVLPAG